MIFEIISVSLAIATGIAATLAFIYRRGISEGVDRATGKRIEQKLYTMQADGDTIHAELKEKIEEINHKVDHLQGSFETFKDLIKK